jgi:hypothetical protein
VSVLIYAGRDSHQNTEDSSKFCLVEVYMGNDAAGEHKKTAHYATWAETVKDMMAEPRSSMSAPPCLLTRFGFCVGFPISRDPSPVTTYSTKMPVTNPCLQRQQIRKSISI